MKKENENKNKNDDKEESEEKFIDNLTIKNYHHLFT